MTYAEKRMEYAQRAWEDSLLPPSGNMRLRGPAAIPPRMPTLLCPRCSGIFTKMSGDAPGNNSETLLYHITHSRENVKHFAKKNEKNCISIFQLLSI
jgi:hypothetical protein